MTVSGDPGISKPGAEVIAAVSCECPIGFEAVVIDGSIALPAFFFEEKMDATFLKPRANVLLTLFPGFAGILHSKGSKVYTVARLRLAGGTDLRVRYR